MAKKYLVIVESPSKTKSIQKYLGSSYEVIASVGHFRDLPPDKMGVNLRKGKEFEPTYEIMDGKQGVVKNILSKAKKAQLVYLATDRDREGEAISAHIKAILPKGTKTKRIRYGAITKKDLTEAIKNATEIDDDLVNAYEARRILDRIVGFKCSWPVKQATGGKSAGRVQSSTLRFLGEREKEIRDFVPITYWSIIAELLTKKKEKVVAPLTKPTKLKVNSKKMAKEIVDALKKGPIKVSAYEKVNKSTKPYAPFTTSTLQQCASSFLGWSPKKTMTVAQELFEQSLITYHRTDSKFIVPEVVQSVRVGIEDKYGAKYCPSKQWHYAKSKNAQEAHEAIRPTDISVENPGSGDSNKLYKMIWKRLVASQMSEAVFLRSKAEFKCKKYVLSTTGSTCTFDGWRKCWDYGKLEDYTVPEMKVGDVLDLIDSSMTEEQTKPPSRYSEASSVKQMEKLGIGRPSTFANTLDTLKNRKYVEIKKKAINVTDLGIKVVEFLVEANFCFVDLGFTANMENDLDRIARAEVGKLCVLSNFYEVLKEDIARAKTIKEEKSKTNYKCKKCDGLLLKKFSKWGEFYSCENYNNKESKCDYRADVGKDGIPVEKVKKVTVLSDFDCPKCGEKMAIRKGRYGEFLGCSKFPKCHSMMTMDGEVIEKSKKKQSKKKKFWGKKKKK